MSKETPQSIQEAIKKIKLNKRERFDPTVELHINLELDTTKDNIRFAVSLPCGTGKTKKVAVMASKKVSQADLELTEEDLSKIEKGQLKPKSDFDVIVVEPQFMPKIAKVAKILGPLGLMPNPKNGTVSEDIDKAVQNIKKGQVEIRTEKDAPVIHTIIGKASFEDKALKENFEEVFKKLGQNKPGKAKPDWVKSVYISTSMGKSVKIDITSL